MREKEGKFSGAADQSIYYRYWQPEGEARALVLIVHGAGEHCGRYHPFATHLVDHGYVVAGLDHIGHGKSDGKGAHVDRFDHHLETLELFRRQLLIDFPDLTMLLLGHSMGGLIAASYLLDHQARFAGCVLSGPAITTEIAPGPVQMALVRFLSAVVPTLGVLQLDASGVSRDPEQVRMYREDPLVHHGRLSARLITELFRYMSIIQSRAAEVTLPLLLLHGEADSMASPQGSKLFYERAGSQDKTLKIYPGLYHEILNEPEKEEVYAEILNWLNDHT
jgi:alpha-beta hydrolase superfamily lysophospholipase